MIKMDKPVLAMRVEEAMAQSREMPARAFVTELIERIYAQGHAAGYQAGTMAATLLGSADHVRERVRVRQQFIRAALTGLLAAPPEPGTVARDPRATRRAISAEAIAQADTLMLMLQGREEEMP